MQDKMALWHKIINITFTSYLKNNKQTAHIENVIYIDIQLINYEVFKRCNKFEIKNLSLYKNKRKKTVT